MPYNLGGGSFTGGTLTSALTIPVGTAAAPSINVTGDTTTGIFASAGTHVSFTTGGTAAFDIGGPGLTTYNTGQYTWSSASLPTAADTGLTRVSAGVAKVTNGGAGSGWLQSTAGRAALNADYTNATSSFTNTNLSITVISGRTYTFEVTLFLVDSTAADGAKIDFAGGTATVTNFRVHGILDDTTTTIDVSAQSTALATVHSIGSLTGQAMWKFHGTFVPSGNGTFIVRAAQNAHTTGTLTVNSGSWIWFEDTPAV